jgi:hypothetical protein
VKETSARPWLSAITASRAAVTAKIRVGISSPP